MVKFFRFVQYINFVDTHGKTLLQISFCADGGVFQMEGNKPIGSQQPLLIFNDSKEPYKSEGACLKWTRKVSLRDDTAGKSQVDQLPLS